MKNEVRGTEGDVAWAELRRTEEGSEPPRYYWLKLPRNFFDRSDIRILACGLDGKKYVYLYIRLLCEAMDKGGRLLLREGVPHDAKTLAALFSISEKTVRALLDRLATLQLLTVDEEGILLTDMDSMVGSEGKSARLMRSWRKSRDIPAQKTYHNVNECDHIVKKSDTEIEIEKEKEKELELELERESDQAAAPTETHARTPTREEVEAYRRERGYRLDAARFIAYYAARGWRLNGEAVADWRALVDSWGARPLGEETRERYGNFDPDEAFRRALERSFDPMPGIGGAFERGGGPL